MMSAMVEAQRKETSVTKPVEPKPEPIAVLPARLPIADVIEKLTAIRAAHPDAEVRRGSANRWEIWPADITSPPRTAPLT